MSSLSCLPLSAPSLLSSLSLYQRPSLSASHHNLLRLSPKKTHLRIPQSPNLIRCVRTKPGLNHPLISPQDQWGMWTALFSIGTLGIWSEKTKIGNMVSAALVSILLGLAASNLGIIPYEAPPYEVVMGYLLPLSIPLLLFRADLRSVMHSTGKLLLAFLLGAGVNSFWSYYFY